MTAMVSVSSLHYYPIKGVRAVDCDNAQFDERGFIHDRRWLIVDEGCQSLTQRDHPILAQVVATPTSDGLRLACGAEQMEVRIPDQGRRSQFKVWGTAVAALDAGDAVAAWLSSLLGRSARLCHMDDAAVRLTPEILSPPAPTNFADMHPFLMTTTASLDALNAAITARGEPPVGMERFRPNIVIETDEAWAEDGWAAVQIGDCIFDLVIPCDRCVVTTMDQKTGETQGKEPLRTLAEIHRSAHDKVTGALFGWRAAPRGRGVLNVGDSVSVIAARDAPFPVA